MRFNCRRCREMISVHAGICPYCRSDVEGYGDWYMEDLKREERQREERLSGKTPSPVTTKKQPEIDLSGSGLKWFLIGVLSVIFFGIVAVISNLLFDNISAVRYAMLLLFSVASAKQLIDHFAKKQGAAKS